MWMYKYLMNYKITSLYILLMMLFCLVKDTIGVYFFCSFGFFQSN